MKILFLSGIEGKPYKGGKLCMIGIQFNKTTLGFIIDNDWSE